jgi:hypothetical protein
MVVSAEDRFRGNAQITLHKMMEARKDFFMFVAG